MSDLPEVARAYILAGPVERIVPAGFEAVMGGDLVCKVVGGEVVQAGVAVALRPSHDMTTVWRAADGLALAWADEPPTADSHLVIYRHLRSLAPMQDGIVHSWTVTAADLPQHLGAEIHFRLEGIAVQAVLRISTLSAEHPGYVYLDIEQPHTTLGFYLPVGHPVYVLRPAASAEVVA
ncbi:hypothetical protein DWB68_15335 [Galactobacter valiniphilus]|uniref:Uncharacterized protein n=1 Tax=Galactobacter valiniphilus TaxID=2676122 RepID=A0A399J8U4_9MICC|nr:hypothetical protein [Galactobacter valiniphilus]RII40937.1 hypothetical protein DWB68_15335 [Galactobacter valiniphilus]